MKLEIKKLGYSATPWRLLADGEELYRPVRFRHPDMGMTIVDEPLCANTKAEMIEIVLRCLGDAWSRLHKNT